MSADDLPLSRRRRLWNWYLSQNRRVNGTFIVGVGIAVLVWAGVASGSKNHPPSAAELTVLLGAGAVLQVAGGVTFGRVGHVDADKARSAVRRLFRLGSRSHVLRVELNSVIDSEDPARHRDMAIRVSEFLTLLEYHLTDAISDWTDVHEEALESTIANLRNQEKLLNEGDDSE
jgi:hypothetical protein